MLTKQKPRPRCKHCKLSLAKKNGKSKHGFQLWHKFCSDCAKAIYNDKYKHILDKKLSADERLLEIAAVVESFKANP